MRNPAAVGKLAIGNTETHGAFMGKKINHLPTGAGFRKHPQYGVSMAILQFIVRVVIGKSLGRWQIGEMTSHYIPRQSAMTSPIAL